MTDALIVGAGPAGSALAYFLARQGVDVLLLDKAEFPRDKTCGDGLTPRAVAALAEMGLLPAVESAGFRINHSLLVGPNGESVEAPLVPGADLPNYALVLPRAQLDVLLLRHALAAGARFQSRVAVTDLIHSPGGVIGVCASSPTGARELKARFVFIATGAATPLLQRAGLLTHRPVFMRAARAYFEQVNGLGDAFEFYFTRELLPGYGWMFPTSPTTANIGASVIEGVSRIPHTGLDRLLAHPRVAQQLAGARRLGPVKGYPLRIDFLETQTAFPGEALVGEAAGLVNPLTGEGIDYALESAAIAARIFGPMLRSKVPTGEAGRQYARQYSGALRARFERTFRRSLRVRDWGLKPWAVDRGIAVARRRETFRRLVTVIAHGSHPPTRWELLRAAWQLVTG